MKGACEGFDGCECEYCSSQEEPDCPLNTLRQKLDSLLVVLQKSPSMYNEQGDVGMLRSFVLRYNTWVKDHRNPAFEPNKEKWLAVAKALEDLSALRSIEKNLKGLEDIDLYNGEKVIISIKRKDGRVEELDGDWLVRSARSLLE